MYADHFHLTGLPFQLTADPRFFFRSSVHQKAIAYLQYGLEQREGFIVITGEVGAGKTTIVGRLLDTLDSRMYISGRVVSTQLDADNLLRLVASAFGLAQENADKATLLEKLEKMLLATHGQGRRAVLVIDEAQNLSITALEELRMLSNFQLRQDTLLQSFLLGQPQFRITLGRPELDQLRQRVIASFHLGPLSARETHEYIEHRLKHVGWQGKPSFTDDAYALIHRETGGIPRKINSLCSRLLLFCYIEGLEKIDIAAVSQVMSELETEFEAPSKVQPVSQSSINEPIEAVFVESAHTDWSAHKIQHRLSDLEARMDRQEKIMRHSFSIAADFLDRNRSG